MATFQSVEWILPPYFQLGYLHRIADRVAAAPDPLAELHAALPTAYDPTHLAAMFLDCYSKTPHVRERRVSIGEAIEAAQLGRMHAAVSGLVPAIEGAVRRLSGRDDWGTRWLIAELRTQAAKLPSPLSDADEETVAMMNAFADYLASHMLAPTSVYSGATRLNRHGIDHGIFHDGYGTPANFYRLVSFLDVICFFIARQTDGISMLAPPTTPASDRLVAYYSDLRALGATRP